MTIQERHAKNKQWCIDNGWTITAYLNTAHKQVLYAYKGKECIKISV
jgi:hypothetical protein